ncbi:hypothetical protein KY386_01990 [Candidatus Parcubacteria bacterium]|nr:hypothetical protein [Candidatus Parcubacteria bacterium]
MARTTKVVGFSLPPEIHAKIESFIKSKHKTRSEFFRELIDLYFTTAQQMTNQEPSGELDLRQPDLAKILRSYWLAKSQSNLKIIITGLAIIGNSQNQVLIASRKHPDEIIENLTWSFPGGRLTTLEFATELKQRVKEATNLDVSVNNLIAARVFPDSTLHDVQVITLYFDCRAQSGYRLRQARDYDDLKWVKPLDVFRYFTSSTSDEVARFLAMLQQA